MFFLVAQELAVEGMGGRKNRIKFPNPFSLMSGRWFYKIKQEGNSCTAMKHVYNQVSLI